MNVKIIFSAERAEFGNDENLRRTQAMHAALHREHVAFRAARGCYKGQQERSVVATVRNVEDHLLVLSLAFATYSQDAVLLVYPDRDDAAEMLERDGTLIQLGKFTKVDEQEAMQAEGWTRVRRFDDRAQPFDYFVVRQPKSDYIPYRADPDRFRDQMAVFERMRNTESAYRAAMSQKELGLYAHQRAVVTEMLTRGTAVVKGGQIIDESSFLKVPQADYSVLAVN